MAKTLPDLGLRPLPDPLSNATNWAKACPNPWPLTKACLTCGQWGHWKIDCTQGRPGAPGGSMLPLKPPVQPCENYSSDGTQVPAPLPVFWT